MKKINIALLIIIYCCLMVFIVSLRAQENMSSLKGMVLSPSSIHKLEASLEKQQLDIAFEYIQDHIAEWNLESGDIDGMTISDIYKDRSSGITRIYLQQRYGGIPVHHALMNLCLNDSGQVYFSGNRFIANLARKVNAMVPTLTPLDGIQHLTRHHGLQFETPQLQRQSASGEMFFDKNQMAREDIRVMLMYQPFQERVHLVWDVLLSPVNSLDKWSSRIDAITGEMLHESNWTISCQVDEHRYSREEDMQTEIPSFIQPVKAPVSDGAHYNVWPAPYDSPMDGPRQLAINPWDTIASPFGWHDINGQPGAEYTITRGNNTAVYQDRYDLGYSSGDEPDGGPDLHFDFPYDPSWEPYAYRDASVVNLFYWLNYMHDFSYRFGFDEAAGNFQRNNYGKGGLGNDFIWGVAQGGANTGLQNNAKYIHSDEGSNSAIFMFPYIRQKRYLHVEEPATVRGSYYTILPSDGWGPGAYVTDIPVTGEMVLIDDGVENPLTTDACETIINTNELAGKIALIDRGGCQFGYKALQAQNAGAIAVVFLNNQNQAATMGAGPDGVNVTIPVVMINEEHVEVLRPYFGTGLMASLYIPDTSGPDTLTCDFQSTTIAHEFGHGISVRLIGGPGTSCLDNDEKMGEGWSDFFGLVTTVQPGDTGEKPRGLGTYVMRESPESNGIRFHPFSTDMNITPYTYGDINANQQRHYVGEVWASMLWDMYWALVDRYGWSQDQFDEASGNYKAIRLVMDGLKNVVCDPGFVDARDAILAADQVLYQGENSCLLWEVFARRGLGYSADQGSPYSAGDQTEAFDLPPTCENIIKIEKSVSDFIHAGDDIHVTLTVTNFKTTSVTQVLVTDKIPGGTSFELNSSNYAVNLEGDVLEFELSSLNPGEEKIITYTLNTSSSQWSLRKFLDEVDEEDPLWIPGTIGPAASNLWHITDSIPAYSGSYAWKTQEIVGKSQQVLMLNPNEVVLHVDGENPAFRFMHRYQTEPGSNGGIVEVRELGTSQWKKVENDIIRNGYPWLINHLTFLSSPTRAFSGNSGPEFKASYIDLTSWKGKDIQLRFRFGTCLDSIGVNMGWLIDDMEFMDLLSYNSEACVTSEQGDFECAFAPESGTIVDSREETTATAAPIYGMDITVYPNPATDFVNIQLSDDFSGSVQITLTSINGSTIFQKSIEAFGQEQFTLLTEDLPAGIYCITVTSENGQCVKKLVIR